jgi:hypothetical protein
MAVRPKGIGHNNFHSAALQPALAYNPEAGDEAELDRVAPALEDDRYRRGCGLGRQCGRTIRGNHCHLSGNKIGRQLRQFDQFDSRPSDIRS